MVQTLKTIRTQDQGILALGSHRPIIQSILDFDYASGKQFPSIVGIIAGNRTAEKYFFGRREILIPCYRSIAEFPKNGRERVQWFLNLQSGRRAAESTIAFFDVFPAARGGHIFAENVPEKHALDLAARYADTLILGPSGVGLLVPGHLKLGAIGGVQVPQMAASHIAEAGSIAVIATSGGMVSELIRAVADRGCRLSFAACIGGDRFPTTPLSSILALVEADRDTEALVYFGELGGQDEYEIVALIRANKLTKPILAYIAGVADDAFPDHVQFGHAKALVHTADESASAKREALRAAGVVAPTSFESFLDAMNDLPKKTTEEAGFGDAAFADRRPSILSTRKIFDTDAPPAPPFVKSALEALLGRRVQSKTTVAFMDEVFALLIDHGGHVSGAVNTMIAARAGKDLVSSLVAGLLTIGPRFGGAVNAAAQNWLSATGGSPEDFVAAMNKKGELIPGIGHRKYRVGLPDPRVEAIAAYAKKLKKHPHYDFARAVEKVMTGKNGKLILNVDGAIAALSLDVLAECESASPEELQELVQAEFFNALFVIPRSVGFIAHFMEQKRHDEGLFRLPDELLFERDSETG